MSTTAASKTRKRPASRSAHRSTSSARAQRSSSRSSAPRARPGRSGGSRKSSPSHASGAKGIAAHELELFLGLLKKCKRAVGGFTDEQKTHLRSIMSKAHKAIDKLHS